jgi:hypothetical protein
MKKKFTIIIAAAVLVAFYALAQSGPETNSSPAASVDKPDAGNLRTFIELARSDLKNQKAIIIAQNMELTEAEGAEFWPLQRDYQNELSRLNDEKLALIVSYAKSYNADSLTDQEATELARESFNIEAKKTGLKRAYFKKMVKIMPAKKVARFFQIDNQLNLLVDLQVAASVPLIK